MILTVLKFSVLDLTIAFSTIFLFGLIGIKTGNSGANALVKMIREDPLYSLLVGVIVYPFFEELVFRGFPGLILWASGAKPGLHWVLGTTTAFFFAVIHGFENDDGDFILPIPQFIGGLIFWYVARQYGLAYAFLVHATSNAVVIVRVIFS